MRTTLPAATESATAVEATPNRLARLCAICSVSTVSASSVSEKESWADTFIEEEEDIEKHLTDFWAWVTYIAGLIWDVLLILRDMSMGFFDEGKFSS